jgi:hypothetical protein
MSCSGLANQYPITLNDNYAFLNLWSTEKEAPETTITMACMHTESKGNGEEGDILQQQQGICRMPATRAISPDSDLARRAMRMQQRAARKWI